MIASPCSIRALAARKAHWTKSKPHFQYICLHKRGKPKSKWNGDQAEMQVQNSKGANLKHRLKLESRRHAIEQLHNNLWSGDTLPFK